MPVIDSLWDCMFVGVVLMLVPASGGWVMGRWHALAPVRLVRWWLTRVLLPRLRSASWLRRTGVIAVNNITILTMVMWLGAWPKAAFMCVAAIGAGMGLAMRILAELPDEMMRGEEYGKSGPNWSVRIGVGLNLLEPPAIVLAIGLSVAQGAMSYPAGDAWETYARWVVPAMLAAAGGEALWLGALRNIGGERDHP